MKFEDEIERVARELEAKKLSSKSSTWAGKSTPATAPPSNTANPLRMLVGNSKQQQVVAVAAAAEIAAAPTTESYQHRASVGATRTLDDATAHRNSVAPAARTA